MLPEAQPRDAVKISALLLLCLCSSFDVALSQDVRQTELRVWHENAYKDKNAAEEFYGKMAADQDSLPALELGYKAMAAFMLSYHEKNPHTKLKYFLEGKEEINRALQQDPGNPEIRFLRFSVQTSAPDFLRYQENIGEDKTFLLEALNTKSTSNIDRDLEKRIVEYLLQTKFCSKSEKKALKQMETY